MAKYARKREGSGLLVKLLLIVTAIAVAVTVWALFFRDSGSQLAPDYAPQEEEQYAQTIPGEEEDKLKQPEGGGAVSLSYAREVTIDLPAEEAQLFFANPGKSNQDMVLQIVVRDQVIVQSGTLKPGNQVVKLELLDGAAKMLSAGGYDGKFVVLYYDAVTGEKAVVNTEIPVSITVNS